MSNEKEFPERKSTRLKNFDYSTTGAYFITLCTLNRQRMLSRIVGGDVLDAPQGVELLPYGKVADKYIKEINSHSDVVTVEKYVIMPNHIHIMLFVNESGASRTSPPTRQHSAVSQFVSTLKRFCNKEYGKNIWQRHYYDHIIRNRDDYDEHIKYIHENPIRWYYDDLYVES